MYENPVELIITEIRNALAPIKDMMFSAMRRKIIEDPRFSISKAWLHLFDKLNIVDYEFCDIDVSVIKRQEYIFNNGQPFALTEHPLYEYLMTKDRNIMRLYFCKLIETNIWGHKEGFIPREYLDSTKNLYLENNIPTITRFEDFVDQACDSFDVLLQKIEANGYNPQKGVIIVDWNNIILDGNHRISCIIALGNNTKKIKVLRLKL